VKQQCAAYDRLKPVATKNFLRRFAMRVGYLNFQPIQPATVSIMPLLTA
jgi:hypothetical protein